jgi:hypothetical protein
MGSLVLAFSIDKQIEQIGSIAGFAAIVGLAVLSLLYFAQAREVKRLREWAGRAPERDAELQQRVADEAARRATGAAPAARPATAAAAATAAAQAAIPRPAAAPATAAGQTAVVKPGTPPGAPAPAGATPAATAPSAAPPAAPPAAGAKPVATTPAPATSPPVGAAPASPVPPVPSVLAQAAAAGAARPRRTVTVGSTPASATVPPRRDEPEERDRLFSGRAIAATAVVAALVVVVLLVSGVLGGGDDPAPAGTTPTTAATAPAETAVPAPADTAVAVLNGTAVTGLARQAADRLEARGYPDVATRDAFDQQQQVSHVAYADGFEGAAQRVARILDIPASQVVPLDPSTQSIAGDGVELVVTMGLDQAP